ncbi:MAG TPA: DNA methyltransferase [Roseiflexaceae bacterium]|nr:DNA methyltransferase [Roseiflexaceae bacterium]
MTHSLDNHDLSADLLDDDTLHLARSKVVAALEALGRCETLPHLRDDVLALRSALANGAATLRPDGPGDDTVALGGAYLRGELAQIAESLTVERARYYISRLLRAVDADPRCAAVNDINLNRWKEYDDIVTDSLWQIDRRDASGVHRADYWGNFVPQIPYQMLRRYTRPDEWVIDPFSGLGTTLIEAQRLGRNAIGIDLRPDIVERSTQLLNQERNAFGTQRCLEVGDATCYDFRGALERHGRSSAQLAILHPPYFDIIKFSDNPRDLSNAASIDDFLAMMGKVIDNVSRVLDAGRYLVLVIGDKYARGDWVPLGFHTMNEVLKRGYSLKSIIVKNFEGTAGKRSQKELWRYRALAGGFYVFKHEYIFVMRKHKR